MASVELAPSSNSILSALSLVHLNSGRQKVKKKTSVFGLRYQVVQCTTCRKLNPMPSGIKQSSIRYLNGLLDPSPAKDKPDTQATRSSAYEVQENQTRATSNELKQGREGDLVSHCH